MQSVVHFYVLVTKNLSNFDSWAGWQIRLDFDPGPHI